MGSGDDLRMSEATVWHMKVNALEDVFYPKGIDRLQGRMAGTMRP